MAGDAAAVLGPESSHGVLRALLSGAQVAHVIERVWRGMPEAVAASAYGRWLREGVERDVANLRGLYAGLPGAPAWVKDGAEGGTREVLRVKTSWDRARAAAAPAGGAGCAGESLRGTGSEGGGRQGEGGR